MQFCVITLQKLNANSSWKLIALKMWHCPKRSFEIKPTPSDMPYSRGLSTRRFCKMYHFPIRQMFRPIVALKAPVALVTASWYILPSGSQRLWPLSLHFLLPNLNFQCWATDATTTNCSRSYILFRQQNWDFVTSWKQEYGCVRYHLPVTHNSQINDALISIRLLIKVSLWNWTASVV
jgi:hypothetical protein